MVKNFISAADAKQLTATSDKLLNQAYKLIKEMASYGHSKVNFDIYDVADTVISKMTINLVDAGYSVETITDEDNDDKPVMLQITW